MTASERIREARQRGLQRVNPPRGMLELVTSREPWFLSHQCKPPARVVAISQAAMTVSLEGIGKVPVDEISAYWKAL